MNLRTRQPARLRETLDGDSPLALGLRAARARQPGEGEADAAERRLLAALGTAGLLLAANATRAPLSPVPATSSAGAAAASGPATVALKAVVALLLGAGGIMAAIHFSHRPPVHPSLRSPSAVAAVPVAPPPEDTVPAKAWPEVVAREQAGNTRARPALPGDRASTRAPARHRGARAQAAGMADRLGRESGMIERARAALAADPEQSLTLCGQHQREFPDGGVMAEEREAIAISALVKLQRVSEARARAATFDERYPGSPYGQQLHERLQGASRP